MGQEIIKVCDIAIKKYKFRRYKNPIFFKGCRY